MALTDFGTKSYNGRAFSENARYHFSFLDEYNQGGTAVIGRRYTLEVWDYITNDDTEDTDSLYTAAKDALSEPRAELNFGRIGFGVLQSGGSYGVDLEYGPRPEIMDWVPVGAHNCCYFHWRCSGLLPNCDNENPIVAMEFESVTSWDGNLLATVTYSGYIRVRPETNGSTITRTADSFRASIQIPVLDGYKRTPTYTLRKDKITLDFVFHDTELAAPLPEGVSHATGEHRVSSRDTAAIGDMKYTSSVSVHFVMAPGKSKGDAFQAFQRIVLDRINQSRRRAEGKVIAQALPLFSAIDFADELFGRGVSLHTSWIITTSLEEILAATGIFSKVPGAENGLWRASISEQADGFNDLFHPGSEAIVSICDAQELSVAPYSRAEQQNIRRPVLEDVQSRGVLKSWMAFVTGAMHNLLTVKRSPSQDVFGGAASAADQARPDADGYEYGVPSNGSAGFSSPGSGADPVVGLATATATAVFCGEHITYGEGMECPTVISIGGQTPVSVGKDVVLSKARVAVFHGTPIFRTAWRKRFVIPAQPTGNTVVKLKDDRGDPKVISPDSTVKKKLGGSRGRGGTFANGQFSGGSGAQFLSGNFSGAGGGTGFTGGWNKPAVK